MTARFLRLPNYHQSEAERHDAWPVCQACHNQGSAPEPDSSYTPISPPYPQPLRRRRRHDPLGAHVRALTEKTVLELLRQRHTASGNGGAGEHAFLTHVRNAAGFGANRTFDAVAVNLWPSRGLAINVFEVKISRADWRRELAKPDKAEDACKIADRFWVVAPNEVVKDGELPPSWGLLEVHGDGNRKPWRLREHTPAPWLQERTAQHRRVPRGLVVAMLRAAPGAVPDGKIPAPTQVEFDAAYKRGVDQALQQAKAADDARRLACESAVEGLAELRDALVAAGRPGLRAHPRSLARQAAVIAAALTGEDLHHQLVAARDQLRQAVETLDAVVSGSAAVSRSTQSRESG